MATDDVTLKVGADTSEAEKNLARLDKNSQAISSSISGAFGAIKAAAAAAVAVFAGKQVIDFFASGIEAAIAQEQAMSALGQQLQLTGEFSTEALDKFAAFADEMERTSQFGDDVVLSQIAVAKSFGLTNEQAQDVTKAAIELSAATGQTLDGAVQALGKTFSGVTGKLDEQIPALKGLTQEALKSGDAIKIVLDRFGGSAEAQILTFAGGLKQAENAFGNLQEAFGRIIVENSAVLAAIGVARDIFADLQAIVEENQGAINSFISTGLKVLATSVSVGVEAIGFLIRAMEGLSTVVTIAFGTLVDGVSIFSKVWRASFGFAASSVLELTDAIGLTDGAQAKFEQFAANATAAIEGFSDATFKFAAENAQKFESFNQGFQKFQGYIDGAAQKIFDADNKVGASAKKAQAERSAAASRAVVDIKAIEKATAEFAKFQESITTAALSDSAKIEAERSKQLAQLQTFVAQGVATTQQAADLRIAIEKTAADKIAALQVEAAKKAADEQKRIAEESRANIEAIAANPLKIAVQQADIQPANISQGQAGGIAAGVGAANAVLGGADGAKGLIASGVGAVADTLIPGIGGAVGPLVSALAQGPDAVKALVTGFVESIPTIIEAIADSIPVLVEVLIDTLIVKGGIIKIAIALVKGIVKAAIGIVGAIGKAIFGGIKFDGIGQNIGGGIMNGVKKLLEFDKKLRDAIFNAIKPLIEFDKKVREAAISFAQSIFTAISNGVKKFLEIDKRIRDAINGVIANLFKKFLEIDTKIRNSINQAILTLFNKFKEIDARIRNSINEAIANLFSRFQEFDNRLKESFKAAIGKLVEAFKNFDQKIKDGFKNAIGSVVDAIKNVFSKIKLPELKTPAWLQKLIDGVKNLFKTPSWIEDIKNLFSGGGGSGGFLGGFGFARGITEVPSGFPNDTFPARLTSGERVVDTAANSDLKEFLAAAKAGKFGVSQDDLMQMARMSAGQQTGPITIELKLDRKVLAREILNLNRLNERLAV